jgi:hypothetical protein
LRLEPKRATASVIEVRNGEGQILQHSDIDRFGEWTSLTLEDVPWAVGEPLTLQLRGPAKRRAGNYVAILDRAVLTWKQGRAGADE